MTELEKLAPILIGEKIILRPIDLNDALAMFEYTNNQDNVYWITVNSQKNLAETKTGIQNYFLKDPVGKYGIILKSENKLIGTIDLRDQKSFYDLGYILNQKYQGHGYAFQALKLLLTEIFVKTEIKKVCAKIDLENNQSNALIKKFGFKIKRQFEELNPKLNQKRNYYLWILDKKNWNEWLNNSNN